VMGVDEAIRRGLIVDEQGHRLAGDDHTMKSSSHNFHRQSRSFETALRQGMIDTRLVTSSRGCSYILSGM